MLPCAPLLSGLWSSPLSMVGVSLLLLSSMFPCSDFSGVDSKSLCGSMKVSIGMPMYGSSAFSTLSSYICWHMAWPGIIGLSGGVSIGMN